MPITKTAKRALRSSNKKAVVNKTTKSAYEIAIRLAKKRKTSISVSKASSLVDRAAKKGIIHKNKAARIKSSLSKLVKPSKASAKKTKKNILKK